MGEAISFTLRDLNRRPASVLAAVRRFGRVEVRTRGGEVFTVTSEKGSARPMGAAGIRAQFAELWSRQKKLGLVPPDVSEDERINRIIAGEE